MQTVFTMSELSVMFYVESYRSPWGESVRQERNRTSKVRQHDRERTATEKQRRALVAFHSARIAAGLEHDGRHWTEIVENNR